MFFRNQLPLLSQEIKTFQRVEMVADIYLVCQWFIDMGNSTCRDYETFILHFVIHPFYEAFHHSQIAVDHTADHTGNCILPQDSFRWSELYLWELGGLLN